MRAAKGIAAVALNRTSAKYVSPRYQSSTVSSGTLKVAFEGGGVLKLDPDASCPDAIAAGNCEAFALLTAHCTRLQLDHRLSLAR